MNAITAPHQLDKLRILEQPYKDHYAVDKDEVIRSHYVALLLMVLLSEGSISEQQQRMLDLWLPSMNLVGRQAELCDLAGNLAKDKLGEATRLLQQDPRLIRSLLLDVMIFSRVDKSLTDTTTFLLEALSNFLGLKERVLNDIVYLAALILGLPTYVLTKPQLSRVFCLRTMNDLSIFMMIPLAKKSWCHKPLQESLRLSKLCFHKENGSCLVRALLKWKVTRLVWK
ncbi:hypothetical protein ACK32A_01360 [Aeromonas enteropelogenes]|uniref:hypothetical protein n=1 Tax=Aeromonas enteropelogenes TaxID=29489 RepID=UPI00398A0196